MSRRRAIGKSMLEMVGQTMVMSIKITEPGMMSQQYPIPKRQIYQLTGEVVATTPI